MRARSPFVRSRSRSRSSRAAAPGRAVLALLAAVVLAASPLGWGAPREAAAQETDADAARAGLGEGRYFAATGHNLGDLFLPAWERAGGEAVLGAPLSEERFVPGGGVQQTFAGITLVFDPAQAEPWDIQGQHLGPAVHGEQAPRSARNQVTGCTPTARGCRFFPETGHTVAGDLARVWAAGGDLPIFGLPVSEPFREDGATVQVFERVVLEVDGSGAVRARPLAADLAAEAGLVGADPAFLPAPPTGGTTTLVEAGDGLRLRAGPSLEAEVLAVLPDGAEFIAPPGRHGAWVPGYVDGFSGWVSAEFLTPVAPLPARALTDWTTEVWQGAALGETNVRSGPTTQAPAVETLAYGDPVEVAAWVEGEEVFEGADLWAQLGPSRYVYARNIGRNAPVAPPPPPADAPSVGRWIDVDLTQQLMVAYEGRTAVRTVVTTTGMAGWETPPGLYQILSRVANETMTSGAIGAENHYKLEDVLFTQYFTDLGHAIHFAWWRTPETIGRPGSHGCLNLLLDDALFFWEWAGIGTPVYVHA